MARPLIVAHRGIHEPAVSHPGQNTVPENTVPEVTVAENTVAAITGAAAAGADAVELDVRMSRDGALVLGHDPIQWNRSARPPRPYLVRLAGRRSLGFLTGLDDAVAAAAAAGVGVKLDVKAAAAVPALAAWCADRHPAGVAIWCRSPALVTELVERDLVAEVALLSNRRDADGYVTAAVDCRATAVSFHPSALNRDAVLDAHARGLTVYAWIRHADEHRAAIDLGVDAVVTDWVRQARAALG